MQKAGGRLRRFQVVQLIEGCEGYGVATVLGQIVMNFPAMGWAAMARGRMTEEVPRERLVWLGRDKVGVSVARSTLAGILAISKNLIRWWSMAGQIAKNLPQGQILLHCHSVYLVLIAALVRIRRGWKNTRIVFHFHSTMNKRRLLGALPTLQRIIVGSVVDAIIAVSEAVAEYWRPIRCPVYVVYNGLPRYKAGGPPPYFVSRAGIKNVLLAASLLREKGHLVSIEAMKLLGPRVKEFHLWIAGGPLEEAVNPFARELREAVQRLDLEANVTLLGHVKDFMDAVPLGWVALQLRITPEPCGLWILEAMRGGLPVIASATGGTPELVRHEREGLLVPPNDPRAVAEAILRLAEDRELRNRLARNAELKAKEFSVDRFVTGIQTVYADLGMPAGGP